MYVQLLLLKTMKKKWKKTLKAINKTLKALIYFLLQTIKNYKCMKKKVKSYWLMLFAICFLITSCGSTKVSVDRPAQGTSTTITVTTNNPISTEVNPNVELKNTKYLWEKM